MPSAVLQFELGELPARVTGLERYERALVLLRVGGTPVGQAWLPVWNGCIDGADLRDALVDPSNWRLWERWLEMRLGWEAPAPPAPPPSATVAVLTRDRPEDLRRCLDALVRLPDDGQELLVVDNCPATDATAVLVGRYERVRYVREDRPGASAARNRALREARHDVVAFTDDDAAPDPGWLRALVRNFDDPLVYCVTGLTMPLELETPAQEWFEWHSPFGRGFYRLEFSGARRNPILVVGRLGASVNMALRRSLLEEVGTFDEALGPGTLSRSGEDFDMFARILARGFRVVYDPAALSWHRHRREWREMRRTIFGYGVGVYASLTRAILVEHEWSAPKAALGWLYYKQLPQLARSLLRRRGSVPLDLLVAELRGCLAGPWAYLAGRRRLRGRGDRP